MDPATTPDNESHGIIHMSGGIQYTGPTYTGPFYEFYDTVRNATSTEISDAQVEKIAEALAAKAEAAALAERPRQRRREWKLLIVGLVAGALLSIPIGILVNLIS